MGAHSVIDCPALGTRENRGFQEQSTPVEACSLWEAELITHRKTAAGLELTRGFASQRKSVLPQGLADSALVILSKQDKHWANPLCRQSHQPAAFFCWLTCFYRGKDNAVLARSQIPVFLKGQEGLLSQRKTLQAPRGFSVGRKSGKNLNVVSKKVVVGTVMASGSLWEKKTLFNSMIIS